MSLRQRLVAYVVGMHLVFLGGTLWFWRQQPVVVVVVELLLLASATVGLRLVGRVLTEVLVGHGVVRHQMSVAGDLAHQIASGDVLRMVAGQPPAGHEEDGLQPAAVELFQDERSPLQIRTVVEGEQQLARTARWLKTGSKPVPRRIPRAQSRRRARIDGLRGVGGAIDGQPGAWRLRRARQIAVAPGGRNQERRGADCNAEEGAEHPHGIL